MVSPVSQSTIEEKSLLLKNSRVLELTNSSLGLKSCDSVTSVPTSMTDLDISTCSTSSTLREPSKYCDFIPHLRDRDCGEDNSSQSDISTSDIANVALIADEDADHNSSDSSVVDVVFECS